MILKMFAVRDRSAEFFFPPFFMRSDAEARRAFGKLMGEPQRAGAPSEYELVSVGSFDDQTGYVDAADLPQHIVFGNEVIDNG